MSQKLMCDKTITTLQIATNYTTLPTRDLAGNSTHILISNCWFSCFEVYQNSKDGQENEQIIIFDIDFDIDSKL